MDKSEAKRMKLIIDFGNDFCECEDCRKKIMKHISKTMWVCESGEIDSWDNVQKVKWRWSK